MLKNGHLAEEHLQLLLAIVVSPKPRLVDHLHRVLLTIVPANRAHHSSKRAFPELVPDVVVGIEPAARRALRGQAEDVPVVICWVYIHLAAPRTKTELVAIAQDRALALPQPDAIDERAVARVVVHGHHGLLDLLPVPPDSAVFVACAPHTPSAKNSHHDKRCRQTH